MDISFVYFSVTKYYRAFETHQGLTLRDGFVDTKCIISMSIPCKHDFFFCDL